MGGSTNQALLQAAALSGGRGSLYSQAAAAEVCWRSRAAVHKAAQALSWLRDTRWILPRAGATGRAGGDPFCAEWRWALPCPPSTSTTHCKAPTRRAKGTGGAPRRHVGAHVHHSRRGAGGRGGGLRVLPGSGVYLSSSRWSFVLRFSPMPRVRPSVRRWRRGLAGQASLCGLELGIKWVNDLYYQGRKVCGILTEAGTDMESGQLEWLVVGIGLNLTTSPADWPEELARTAGSLYPGGPAPVSRAVLAGAIARELLSLCPAFDCLDEYRARCFVPGHWVTVCTGAETYAAKALFIDDAGRLVVEREGGRQIALQHGEVSIRPTSTI